MSQVYTPDQKIPGFTLLVLTGKSVVSIQVVLTRTQTVKLHTNLVHPNYSFCEQGKHFGWMFFVLYAKDVKTINLNLDCINLYRNDFVSKGLGNRLQMFSNMPV